MWLMSHYLPFPLKIIGEDSRNWSKKLSFCCECLSIISLDVTSSRWTGEMTFMALLLFFPKCNQVITPISSWETAGHLSHPTSVPSKGTKSSSWHDGAPNLIVGTKPSWVWFTSELLCWGPAITAEISVCYTTVQLESFQGELLSFQKKKKAGMDLLA